MTHLGKTYSIHHIRTFVKAPVIIVLCIVFSISFLPAASAVKAETYYFSIEVPDNWVYRTNSAGFGASNLITLVPNNFSDFLLQVEELDSNTARETFDKGGSAIFMNQDADYTLKNAPLDTYVNFKTNSLNIRPWDIISKENATVGNEKAVKITTTGGGGQDTNYGGIFYFFLHNDDAYSVQYVFNKNNNRYLPQFEEMVKSFNFVSSNIPK